MAHNVRFYRFGRAVVVTLGVLWNAGAWADAPSDPLPSWNDGPAKQTVLTFVKDVTDKSGPKYVDPTDRIATFDQDGTTWVEHPLYAQGMFMLDRVHELASKHPAWREKEPFKAVLAGDREAMTKFTERDWVEIVAVTHSGMTPEEFHRLVRDWLATAKHPRFKRPYTDLVYQPMLEVMRYLRANGFKTFIVTGGGQEFVRAYGPMIYGIPSEQIVGSSVLTKFVYQEGKPVLLREPNVFFVDDHAGKPVGISLFIGRRPCAAFGNSDGDREMLEWTGAGKGARLTMLVYHDDAEREYAYGPAGGLPNTKVGEFPQSLMNEAAKRGWTVIRMKKDWKVIYPFEKR